MKEIYRDQVVIVTGASAGIGRQLALQLAGQGARVVLAARDRERLEKLAAECREAGGEALPVPTDVGDKEQCRALIQAAVDTWGGIDCLINNAGYGLSTWLRDLEDITEFERLMQVNFMGSVYCTKFALEHLIARKGRLVAISSVAGLFSGPGSSAYCASKFAMRAFFDAMRGELVNEGVSVTVIYPGYVVTEFMSRVVQANGIAKGPEALSFYKPWMMSAEKCARITLKAAAKGKREVVLKFYAKVGRWLQLLAPGLIDGLARNYRNKRDRKIPGRTSDE